ncbi:MAG: hypothetical protein M9934_01130 [Thermomicrobiales bacterium]|nr:hypothetical protein [Thermomicrobiales bacterium]
MRGDADLTPVSHRHGTVAEANVDYRQKADAHRGAPSIAPRLHAPGRAIFTESAIAQGRWCLREQVAPWIW